MCSEDDATREQIKKAFAAIGGGAAGGEAAPVRNADGSVETIGFDAPTRANAGPVTNLGVVGGGKKGAPKRIVAAAAAPEAPAGPPARRRRLLSPRWPPAAATDTRRPAAPPRRTAIAGGHEWAPPVARRVEGFGAPGISSRRPPRAKKAKMAPIEAVAPAAQPDAGGKGKRAAGAAAVGAPADETQALRLGCFVSMRLDVADAARVLLQM